MLRRTILLSALVAPWSTVGCQTVVLDDPRTERAEAMTRVEDWSAAAAMWNTIYIESGCTNEHAGLESAAALLESGRGDAAVRRLAEMKRRGFDSARLHELNGLGFEATGHAGDALGAYEHALERDADRPISLERLGALTLRAGDGERAIEHLRASIRADASRGSAHRLYTMALVRAGDPDRAATAVDRALEREVLSRNDVREAVARFGGDPRATDWLFWLVSRDPQDASAAHALGLALSRVGNQAAGLQWLERAAETAPGDVAIVLDYSDALRAADLAASADALLEHLRGLELTAEERNAVEARAVAPEESAEVDLEDEVSSTEESD